MSTGYIFVLDGVITDTAEYHYRAWQQLAEEEGIPFNRKENDALRGVSRQRSLEILLNGRHFPESILRDFMDRKNQYYRDYLREVTPDNLLPGVADFLAEAKDQGIKLGLGSASKNARDVCVRLGILNILDAFGDGNSVVNPKPAPDLFIWVAGRFGLNPRRCIVFEDAAVGIEAALAGGFLTCGIGPEERVGSARWIRPDLIGAHVEDFPVPD